MSPVTHRRLGYAAGLLIIWTAFVCGPVLIAQALNAAAGTPGGAPLSASPGVLAVGQANENVVSFVLAYIASAFLQWWKHSSLGGMDPSASRTVKTAIAWVTAAASAVGVHASFDAAAGTLLITGLTTAGLLTSVGDTIRQFIFQQFAYRAAIEER